MVVELLQWTLVNPFIQFVFFQPHRALNKSGLARNFVCVSLIESFKYIHPQYSRTGKLYIQAVGTVRLSPATWRTLYSLRASTGCSLTLRDRQLQLVHWFRFSHNDFFRYQKQCTIFCEFSDNCFINIAPFGLRVGQQPFTNTDIFSCQNTVIFSYQNTIIFSYHVKTLFFSFQNTVIFSCQNTVIFSCQNTDYFCCQNTVIFYCQNTGYFILSKCSYFSCQKQ